MASAPRSAEVGKVSRIISLTPRSKYLYEGPRSPRSDAGEIAEILLEERFVQMILGFEIGNDLRRKFALAVKRPAWGHLTWLLAAIGMAGGADKPIPIILDTDIGTDVDDAFALGLILASPELDFRAVTTSGGQTEDRAWMVCRFLTQCGKSGIPVAAGAEPQAKSEVNDQIQYRRHPAAIFNRTLKPVKESAAEVILSELKKQPGEITVVAIGPLTNIARLLTDHPEAAKLMKGLVIMGGSVLRRLQRQGSTGTGVEHQTGRGGSEKGARVGRSPDGRAARRHGSGEGASRRAAKAVRGRPPTPLASGQSAGALESAGADAVRSRRGLGDPAARRFRIPGNAAHDE